MSPAEKNNFKNAAPFEIYCMLIKMNANKATGFDEIPSKFLKICATPLAGPIFQLINLSILECKYTETLKYKPMPCLNLVQERLTWPTCRPLQTEFVEGNRVVTLLVV